MSVKELTLDDFESTILQAPIVLVDFWAPWCGPCRAFAPVFEKSAQAHPDVMHAKVNTQAEQELAATVGIQSIPTIMAFRDGVLVYSQAGAMPPAVVNDLMAAVSGPGVDVGTTRLAVGTANTGNSSAPAGFVV